MHILIAPDSFKESLSAPQVARAIQKGFEKSLPDATFDLMPLGDGGEGTVACLQDALDFDIHHQLVTGPFGQQVEMPYAIKGKTAMFEMADLVGLAKIPRDKRNPLVIETRGLGELILKLAEQGVSQFLIGIGGSGSHDGGIGLAAGLGYRFYDQEGQVLKPVGQSLSKVNAVSDQDVPAFLKKLDIQVLVDVDNPLCGPRGATKVFTKQKGLPQEQQDQVDYDMQAFYQLVQPDLINLKGAGAGGGMAAGLVAFAGGKIVSGIDTSLDLLDFDHRVKQADLVVVGEGRLDKQSLAGKTPIGVARRTPAGIPVIAICGSLADDLPDFPFEQIKAAFPIIGHLGSLDETLSMAEQNLIRTAIQIGNIIRMSEKRGNT